MKIAIGSDLKTHVTDLVIEEVSRLGHHVEPYGAVGKGPTAWPKVAIAVAEAVASGYYDQGILFCWTGTGISLAANKVRGVRAALCNDAETAKGARKWNDANILAMSLRMVSEEVAREILTAWFSTPFSSNSEDLECIEYLKSFEDSYMSLPVGRR